MRVLRRDCRTLHRLRPESNFFLPWSDASALLAARERPALLSYVAEVLRRYLDGMGCAIDRDRCGAEFWVQARAPGHDIPFHWDKDEALRDSFGMLCAPAVSTVTYLSERGAPTVVFEVRASYADAKDVDAGAEVLIGRRRRPIGPGDTRRAAVLVSYPREGKLLAFSGGLLHDVPAALAEDGESRERITLLVNVWVHHKPLAVEPLPPAVAAELTARTRRSFLVAPPEEQAASAGVERSAAELQTVHVYEPPLTVSIGACARSDHSARGPGGTYRYFGVPISATESDESEDDDDDDDGDDGDDGGAVAAALACKARADHAGAASTLKAAIAAASAVVAQQQRRGSRDESAVIATGVVAQYELALLLCQLGRARQADAHLRALGYSWRLGPAIMRPRAEKITEAPRKSPGVHVDAPHVYDGALPHGLVAGLRSALLAETSAFWTEHNYPAPNFFSYRYELGDSPKFIAEQAACALLPLVRRHWPAGASPPKIAEWWVHARGVGGGHQLHFDLDEARLRARGTARHPTLSTVVYLTLGDLGSISPTLVTSQRVGDSGEDAQGWLAWPAPNRILIFDGGLLHGVIPTLPADTRRDNRRHCAQAERRLTLMIGWWPGDACPTSAPPLGELRPCMRPPRAGTRRWTSQLACVADGDVEAAPERVEAEPVGKVWARVADAGGGGPHEIAPRLIDEIGAGAVEFAAGWFVTHPRQLSPGLVGSASADRGGDGAEPEGGVGGGVESGAQHCVGARQDGDDDDDVEVMDLAEARRLAEQQRALQQAAPGANARRRKGKRARRPD